MLCSVSCRVSLQGLGSRRTAARGRLGNVDDRHALFLVIPAMESLDARHVDLIVTEKAGNVDGGGLVRLANLGGSILASLERLDPDHLSLFVVVELRIALPAQLQHVGYGLGEPDQAGLNDCGGGWDT